jgi:hypothetical protein
MSMNIPAEDMKNTIGQLNSGEIAFDATVHGQNKAFLEMIAKTSMVVFKKIPVDLLTPELIDMGALLLCEMEGDMSYHVKDDYEATAINLIGLGHHISFFHRDLLTEKIARCALERNIASTLSYREKLTPSQQALFTPDMLRYAVENDPEVIVKLTTEETGQFDDNFLLSVFRKKPEYSYCLFRVGRPKLFADMVASGSWMFAGVFEEHPRPTTTAKAIQQRMKLEPWMNKEIAYYNAFISNSPLEEIAPLMTSRARRKVLLEIFPADDLLDHFKNDAAMKGCILEDQLGL